MGSSLYNSKLYIDDLKTAMEHTLGKDKLYGATVMVTGASGTIGSFIVDMLCEWGTGENGLPDDMGPAIKLIACGRSTQKLEKRFGRYLSNYEGVTDCTQSKETIDFCELDILSDSSFANLPDIQIDYIIHAAGNAYPSAFVDHYEDTVKGNILGTARLIEYGRSHGCKRFVYVSSGEVYSLDDGYRKIWFEKWNDVLSEADSDDAFLDEPLLDEEQDFQNNFVDYKQVYMKLVMDEVNAKGARSSYPVSKAAVEAMVLSHGNTIVVRPCHTFGPGITGSDDRAHVQFAKKAVAGEDIVLNSAGTQLRSYNYVADAVSGIISAMLVTGINGADRIFDICSRDNEITIRGLAELMAKVSGVSVTVKEADERQKSLQSPINRQILRSEDLENIGWNKAYDLETGVSHYLQILRDEKCH